MGKVVSVDTKVQRVSSSWWQKCSATSNYIHVDSLAVILNDNFARGHHWRKLGKWYVEILFSYKCICDIIFHKFFNYVSNYFKIQSLILKCYKVDWRGGSSTRVPALQVQSPEFKPQSYQKKKRKENVIKSLQ
jgi:hypothetical protein